LYISTIILQSYNNNPFLFNITKTFKKGVTNPIPILLIDDDENYVTLMKTILEDEGYNVDYAYNGHDGLVMAETRKYAAVIID
jgi:response regulator RpfG family c-di-GMP phosphodiesterase